MSEVPQPGLREHIGVLLWQSVGWDRGRVGDVNALADGMERFVRYKLEAQRAELEHALVDTALGNWATDTDSGEEFRNFITLEEIRTVMRRKDDG